jgi:hypothetical protein
MAEPNKRINRTDKFCSSVKKKDVQCVLSNIDLIQCECAHIVPLNGDYGQINFENAELLNNPANGMLLSKELHYLFDMFIWSINPNNYTVIEGIPIKHKYKINIASDYKDKNISINKYKTIILRAECHPFIEIAYLIFLDTWNSLQSSTTLKLEVKEESKIAEITNYKLNPFRNNKNIDDKNKFTTIDKLDKILLEQITDELGGIINNNKKTKTYFNKKHKMILSEKYNLHHESITSYYNKLKKQQKK